MLLQFPLMNAKKLRSISLYDKTTPSKTEDCIAEFLGQCYVSSRLEKLYAYEIMKLLLNS